MTAKFKFLVFRRSVSRIVQTESPKQDVNQNDNEKETDTERCKDLVPKIGETQRGVKI